MPPASVLRVALCQIDTTPGDLRGNLARIAAAAERAAARGADLALFPELAVAGYSPRDLLFRPGFADAAVRGLARLLPVSKRIAILAGTVLPNEGPGRPLSNGAVLLEGGAERARFRKSLLPSYDVFDEARYFEPGCPSPPFPFRGHRLGVTICEDIWFGSRLAWEVPRYGRDPAAELAAAGATVLVNLSASPYHQGKTRLREDLVAGVARRTSLPVLLCNLVGGNDELLFDGASVAVDAAGRTLARGAFFEDDLVIATVEAGEHAGDGGDLATWPDDGVRGLRAALVRGIGDYARKCGFTKALLGLSGGVDSAVTAALAVDALGAARVTGVAMPSRFSSAESLEDAEATARLLGIRLHVAPIEGAYRELLDRLYDVLGEGTFGVMEENLQARIRGVILMGLSNRTGALLLTTGNKSELAVGYCTLYGDMCGGLAPISDVLKQEVYRLARWYEQRGRVPARTLTKAPSAELRPGQTDQDTLPPYELLDRILDLHIHDGLGARAIAARLPEAGADTVATVLRMVARAEYKRKQAAPGLRVTPKAFGMGRRIPLVSSAVADLDDVPEVGEAPPNSGGRG